MISKRDTELNNRFVTRIEFMFYLLLIALLFGTIIWVLSTKLPL